MKDFGLNEEGKGTVVIYLIVGPVSALLSFAVLLYIGYSFLLALGLAWLFGCGVTMLTVGFFNTIVRVIWRNNNEASTELSE